MLMYHHHGVARNSPHMVAEPGGSRKCIDEQIVEFSNKAGESLGGTEGEGLDHGTDQPIAGGDFL